MKRYHTIAWELHEPASMCQGKCTAVYLASEVDPLIAENYFGPKVRLTDDPRELLVTTARDAGFSDAQWKTMFYESGAYGVTFPCFTTKKFIALLLERLQSTQTKGEGQ